MRALDELREFKSIAGDAEAIVVLESFGLVADWDGHQAFLQRDSWLDFARRWSELRRQLRKSVHYCALAVVLADADGRKHGWGAYLAGARNALAQIAEDELVDSLVAK